jgi:hypothetical protein
MALKNAHPLLSKAAEAALKKRGFPNADVVMAWPKIVGPDLAQTTHPKSLSFPTNSRRDGTLTVVTGGAFALTLDMMRPLVLERVNLYFGYTAVTRLRIVQT